MRSDHRHLCVDAALRISVRRCESSDSGSVVQIVDRSATVCGRCHGRDTPGFTTTYYWILSRFVTDTASVPVVYFALQLLAIFTSLAGLYALGRVIGRSSLAGWLTILVAMLPPPILAEARVLLSTHSHAEPAFALQVWALVLFFIRRPTLAMGLLGLAFNLHALNSAYLVVCLGTAMLLEPNLRRSTVRSILVFAVYAQPVLSWLVLSAGQRPSVEWFQHMRVRSAWHSYPWEWEKFWLVLAAYSVWLLGSAIAFRIARNRVHAFHRRVTVAMVAAVIVMCVAGWIFAEVIPVSSVLKAQLLRSTLWLNTVAGPIVAAGGIELVRQLLARRGMAERLLRFVEPVNRSPRFGILCALAVALVAGPGFPALFAKSRLPSASTADWRALQTWARQNTSKDALFLTPPGEEGFRIHSERGIYLEWKDGTQQYFDFEYSSVWWNRLHRVARIEQELTEFSYQPAHMQRINDGYYANSVNDLLDLATEHRLSYVVFNHSRVLPLKHVYSNDAYVVYDVRDLTGTTAELPVPNASPETGG